MDQQTQIILAVIAVVAVIGIIGLFWFSRNVARGVGRRRFNPRQQQQPFTSPEDGRGGRPDCGCGRGRACPETVGRTCTDAFVDERERLPAAIYGVAEDNCCTDGSPTRADVQAIVDMLNADADEERSIRLSERLQLSSAKRLARNAPAPTSGASRSTA